MSKAKHLPVKFGWMAEHPLDHKRVAVVESDWAHAHINALREVLQDIRDFSDVSEGAYAAIVLVLKETE
jgi:hypothetical protein